jgi:hypothetical protein
VEGAQAASCAPSLSTLCADHHQHHTCPSTEESAAPDAEGPGTSELSAFSWRRRLQQHVPCCLIACAQTPPCHRLNKRLPRCLAISVSPLLPSPSSRAAIHLRKKGSCRGNDVGVGRVRDRLVRRLAGDSGAARLVGVHHPAYCQRAAQRQAHHHCRLDAEQHEVDLEEQQ